MVSQQDLRQQASLRAGGRAQQIQRKTAQVQQQRQQQAIEQVATQTSTIDKRLQELESQKGSPQSEIKAGRSLTGSQSYERALAEMKKISFEVEQLKKLKEGLGGGSYYRDFESVIKDISKTGSEIERAHTQRWEGFKSKRESKAFTKEMQQKEILKQLPAGAKITESKIVGGERVISYTLPGQQRAPVSGQVVTDAGVQRVPFGFANEEIDKTYSKFQARIPESEKRKLTQYEMNQRITSDPAYQREIKKIIDKPTTQKEIKKYVTGAVTGFTPEFQEKILSASSFVASTPKREIDIERVKPKEIYSPALGGFVQAVDVKGREFGQATAQVRMPTDIERQRIERGRTRDNILFAPTEALKKDVKEIKRLQSKLEDLSKENIKDEQWVGSEKDLKEYNILIGKLEGIDKTVTTGIGKGKFSREVPITQFDLEKRPISTTFQIFGSIAGSVLGGVGEDVGKLQEKIERVTPTRAFKPFSFGASKPEIGRKAGELIGEVGVGLGKYLTPAGVLIFGAEVGELGVDIAKTVKSGEKITREQKIEVAISGGVILTAGLLKGVQYLKAPIVKTVTRSGRITREVTPRYDKLLGRKPKYTIETKQIKVKGEKPVEYLDVTPKPTKGAEGSGKYIEVYEGIKGYGKEVGIGSKTIVKTREGEIIFSGLSPYTQAGKLERVKTIKVLKKQGFGEGEIKNILRFKRPEVVETTLTGTGKVVRGETGTELYFKGEQREIKRVVDLGQGLKTRGGVDKIKYIKREGMPTGEIGEIKITTGTQEVKSAFLTKEGRPFSKVIQRGKTTEVSDFIVGTKKIGKTEIPLSFDRLSSQKGEGVLIARTKEFSAYENIGIDRNILRKIKTKPTDKIKVIKERAVDTRLEQFRETLPKWERAKFDKLDKLSQSYWEGQVRAGSVGRDISRGQGKSFMGAKLKDLEDKGYSALSEAGVLRKAKPTDWATSKKPIVTELEISRARKIPTAKSRSLVEEGRPDIIYDLDELFGTTSVKVMRGGAKPSSPQYLQQLYQETPIASIVKKVPKPKPTKVPKPKVEPTILEPPKVEPKPVSIYEGKGLYERTEGIEALAPVQRDGQILMAKIDTQVRVDEKIKIDTVQRVKEKPILIEKQITITDTKSKERLELFQPLDIQTKQREAVKVKSQEKLSSRQVLNQLLEIKQMPKQRMPERLKQKETTKPKTPKVPRIVLPLLGQPESKREPAKQALKDFKVFVTKFGKETEIGEFSTLGEARKELKEELIGTLRAGGGIKRGEKKLTFQEIGLFGEEFRPSKVSPFKVIQKKTKRLRRSGETSELQYFRKQKRGSFL